MDLFRIGMGMLTALCAAFTWAGDSGPERGDVVISPMAVYLEHPDEAGFDDDEVGPGIALGWAFAERWMAELTYFESEADFTLGAFSGDADAESAWLNLSYLFPNEGHWQPYVTLGGGRTSYDYPRPTSDGDDDQYNLGVGLFSNLTERVALRADVRSVFSDQEDEFNPMATLGLSILLGARTPAAPPEPPDQDGDGVPDNADRCPNTPPGIEVGPDGCELDRDGDGVPDSRDACPSTPADVAVDQSGCALDSDGDGVADHRDRCPGTEPGARVDAEGCYLELEETVTMDLQLEFDTNSAELRPGHYRELNQVVQFLREYPQADAVIEGHTDNTGAADYNQQLSQRRAQSVLAYLVEQGIPARRLTAVGYGEERPIADNATAEGRQLNRRVTAVIQATRTVRQ
jgi:OOP family OmpA-OmpF porin